MTTLRTLKKLLLGETWILPIGLVIAFAVASTVRSLAPGAWTHVGGITLAAGVLAVLVASVAASVRRR